MVHGERHFWLFTGVLSEIQSEVTRKVGFAGVKGLKS